jgi:hypothetical protein
MKNSDVDSQPKFQAHLQFAQANAQSKIAKELKMPSHTEKRKQRNANNG